MKAFDWIHSAFSFYSVAGHWNAWCPKQNLWNSLAQHGPSGHAKEGWRQSESFFLLVGVWRSCQNPQSMAVFWISSWNRSTADPTSTRRFVDESFWLVPFGIFLLQRCRALKCLVSQAKPLKLSGPTRAIWPCKRRMAAIWAIYIYINGSAYIAGKMIYN